MADIVFKLRETPNPYELGLDVHVRDTLLAKYPNLFPTTTRKYTDFVQTAADLVAIDQAYADGYGDYRYTECTRGFMGGEQSDQVPTVVLHFTKHKNDADKSVPFRPPTFSFGNHRWPPILEALAFIRDNTFPRSTNGTKYGAGAVITGPTYYVREIYQCEVNEGSRFMLEEFFADTVFDIPIYPVPIPRAVYFDLPGVRGGFPECIGPEIKIPNVQTAASVAFAAGNASLTSGAINGQFFPATDFEEWEPYILTDQQDFTNGGWYRRRIRVIPPIQDNDPIIK